MFKKKSFWFGPFCWICPPWNTNFCSSFQISFLVLFFFLGINILILFRRSEVCAIQFIILYTYSTPIILLSNYWYWYECIQLKACNEAPKPQQSKYTPSNAVIVVLFSRNNNHLHTAVIGEAEIVLFDRNVIFFDIAS